MELSELIQKLESCKKASSTDLENANPDDFFERLNEAMIKFEKL